MIPAPTRQPILETERLRLQPLTADDACLLSPLMEDPEVMAFWDVPVMNDPYLFTAFVLNQIFSINFL